MLKKSDKFGSIKMKDICSVKDIVKRIERQVTHWQKIFTKLVSNKGLVSKKQKTKRKKPAQLKKKQSKDLNRHLMKEDTQIENKDKKICSSPTILKELQIKTVLRYHQIAIKNARNPKIWQYQMMVWRQSNRNSQSLLVAVKMTVTLEGGLLVFLQS